MPLLRALQGRDLHPAVEAEAATRLRRLTGLISVGFVLGAVTRRLAWAAGYPLPQFLAQVEAGTAVWAGLSFGFWWYAGRTTPGRVLWLGAFYEILLCMDLAAVEQLLFDFLQPPLRLSFAVLPLLTFPIAVPLPLRRRIPITLLALVAVPAGTLAARWYQGVEAPLPPLWFIHYLPTCAAGALATATGSITFKLSVAASEARRVGSYQLVEKLGGGGMGEVWRGRHKLLVRDAAIKIVRQDHLEGGGEQVLLRFEREAQATSVLRSPHTVQLYDFGRTEDGSFYYAMELLDGQDLDGLVRDHGPLCERRTVHILRQLCRSLAEAHSHGLVHRDIKPANVVLCRLGLEHDFVKVLDFGLVKDVGDEELVDSNVELSRENVIRGTPAFLAPELALGEPVSPRTDLYAVGCVAYWLCTGAAPFEGKTAVEVVAHHLSSPPAPPTQLAPVSEALEVLILQCLAKAPEDRPVSAAALEAALAAIDDDPWTEQEAEEWWRDHEGLALGTRDRTRHP